MVFAYLDPAAGGMIIQSIIAAAVALPFILRSQISRGIAWLRGNRRGNASGTPSERD
jgi:hypothetical protein